MVYSYSLYDLNFINEKIKQTTKDLKRHFEIFKECGFSQEEIYKRGYMKNLQSDLKELKELRKMLFKKRSYLNAKLLSKNIYYTSDRGESGVNYWVFKKGCTKQDIFYYLEQCFLVNIDGVKIYSIYDCTGQRFSSAVDIEEKEKTIVASQSWAYDV